MRVSINLATRPFVELRPFLLRLRIVMAVLAAIAIGLGVWAHSLQTQLDRATGQMDRLRDRTIAAQQERIHSEARMRQPANAAVLDRAHFLNALFLHKSFSWTAVMMDLEQVLPPGVQVTAIEPQVTATGDVVIRLRVAGPRDRAVQLVRNLEHSLRFLQPRLSGEATQARETGTQRPGVAANPNAPGTPEGVQFDILANYNPLPPGEPYPKARAHGAAATPVAEEQPQRPPRNGSYPRYGVILRPHTAAATQAGQGGGR